MVNWPAGSRAASKEWTRSTIAEPESRSPQQIGSRGGNPAVVSTGAASNAIAPPDTTILHHVPTRSNPQIRHGQWILIRLGPGSPMKIVPGRSNVQALRSNGLGGTARSASGRTNVHRGSRCFHQDRRIWCDL